MLLSQRLHAAQYEKRKVGYVICRNFFVKFEDEKRLVDEFYRTATGISTVKKERKERNWGWKLDSGQLQPLPLIYGTVNQ